VGSACIRSPLLPSTFPIPLDFRVQPCHRQWGFEFSVPSTARKEELEQAMEEGIVFRWLTTVILAMGQGYRATEAIHPCMPDGGPKGRLGEGCRPSGSHHRLEVMVQFLQAERLRQQAHLGVRSHEIQRELVNAARGRQDGEFGMKGANAG